jgi:hypothetical protein
VESRTLLRLSFDKSDRITDVARHRLNGRPRRYRSRVPLSNTAPGTRSPTQEGSAAAPRGGRFRSPRRIAYRPTDAGAFLAVALMWWRSSR